MCDALDAATASSPWNSWWEDWAEPEKTENKIVVYMRLAHKSLGAWNCVSSYQ